MTELHTSNRDKWVITAMDRLIELRLEQHAWLVPAAAKVRRWRAEDEANGIYWNTSRDGCDTPNKRLPSDQ